MQNIGSCKVLLKISNLFDRDGKYGEVDIIYNAVHRYSRISPPKVGTSGQLINRGIENTGGSGAFINTFPSYLYCTEITIIQ